MAILKANQASIKSLHDDLSALEEKISSCIGDIGDKALLTKVDKTSKKIYNIDKEYEAWSNLASPSDLLPEPEEQHDYTVNADSYNKSADSISAMSVDAITNYSTHVSKVVSAFSAILEKIETFDTNFDSKLKKFTEVYDDSVYSSLTTTIGAIPEVGDAEYPEMTGVVLGEVVKPEDPENSELPDDSNDEPDETNITPPGGGENPPGGGEDPEGENPPEGGTGGETEGGEEPEKKGTDSTIPEEPEGPDGINPDDLPKLKTDEVPSGNPPEGTEGEPGDSTKPGDVTPGDETDSDGLKDGDSENPDEVPSGGNPNNEDGDYNPDETNPDDVSDGDTNAGTDGDDTDSTGENNIVGITEVNGDGQNDGSEFENTNPFATDDEPTGNPKDDMNAFLGLNPITPGGSNDPFDLSGLDPNDPNVINLKKIFDEYGKDGLDKLNLDPNTLRQMAEDGRNPNLALANAIAGIAATSAIAASTKDSDDIHFHGKNTGSHASSAVDDEDDDEDDEKDKKMKNVITDIKQRVRSSLVLTGIGIVGVVLTYILAGTGIINPFFFVVAGIAAVIVSLLFGYNRYLDHLISLNDLKDKIRIFSEIKQNIGDSLVLVGVGIVASIVTYILAAIGLLNPICFAVAGLLTIIMAVMFAFNKYLYGLLNVDNLINESILSEANKELLREFFKSRNGFNLKILLLLIVLLLTFVLKLFGSISWLWLLLLLLLLLLILFLIILGLSKEEKEEKKSIEK